MSQRGKQMTTTTHSGPSGLAGILLGPFRALGRFFTGPWPILRRDFVHHLRTPRAFRICLVTLLASGLLPLILWPAPGEAMPERIARQAFETYRGTFFASLLLFVPVITASSIAQEREAGTYEMLAMTHVTMWQLLIGKLAAASAYFGVLIILTFPLACTFFLLGGSDAWDFILSLAALFVLVPSLGLIGLSCSVRSKNSARSVYHAALISLLFLLVALQGAAFGSMTLQAIIEGLFAFELDPVSLGYFAGALTYAVAGLAFGIDLLITVRSQVRRARRFTNRSPTPSTPATPGKDATRPTRTARTLPERPPMPRTTWTQWRLKQLAEGIPDGWNPFHANALRFEVSGHGSFRRAPLIALGILVVGIVVIALPVYLGHPGGDSLQYGLLAGLVPLLAHITLSLPGPLASSLSLEFEPLRFELLRGTKMGSLQVLAGKARALVGSQAGLFLLGLGFITMLTLTALIRSDAGGLEVSYRLILILPAFAATYVALTLLGIASAFLGSVIFQRTLQAQILAYFLVLLALFLAPWQLWLWLPDLDLHQGSSPFLGFIALVVGTMQDSKSTLEALGQWAFSMGATVLLSLAILRLGLGIFRNRRLRER